MRIVITGGSGFCGRLLSKHFSGHDVVIASRQNGGWERLTTHLDGADAVINLAGRTVNCRYNAANCAEIYASRLDTTRAIGEAIGRCAQPPRAWLNASSATIYRDAYDRPMDEATGELGTGFSVDVCRPWEQTLSDAHTPKTRKVALRAAMVFAPGNDGVFAAFVGLVRLGFGGPMASGKQFVSWIHGVNFCRAVEFLLSNDALSGAVNLAAPNPLPNAAFLAELRRALKVPIGLPTTRGMLEMDAWLRQTETELLLKSRRVVPSRLCDAGFAFTFDTWATAAAELAR